MPLTLHDLMPISLCIATQELFDRRFKSDFCDNLLLRRADSELEPALRKVKRELNSSMTEQKYLEGHKTAIISNIDKILGLIPRYAKLDLRATESIVSDGKEVIKKIIAARNFEEIAALEPEFKSKITLPVYSLFIKHTKDSTVI